MPRRASYSGLLFGAVGAFVVFCGYGLIFGAGGVGFDTGLDAVESLARVRHFLTLEESRGRWLRIRGLPESSDDLPVAVHRAALRELHHRGFRLCVHLEESFSKGRRGLRPSEDRYLPIDLREAFLRCRHLAENFGLLVDAWEVGNEPDLSFSEDSPASQAAFHKACFLGLRGGMPSSAPVLLHFVKQFNRRSSNPLGAQALILPAPLGMPPGPYFERWWTDNDLAVYADALSYHYYGYADDFTSVYRQFEDAQAGSQSALSPQGGFPLFVSEFGYGLLDKASADTVDGRLRQWNWFQTACLQIEALKPAAAMAFVLRPYTEANFNEFGLLLPATSPAAHHEYAPAELGFPQGARGPTRGRSALGEEVVSPALAYLAARSSSEPHVSLDRLRKGRAVSPVVIDFVPNDGLLPRKSYGGYFVTGFSAARENIGFGEIILYNFGSDTIEGNLEPRGEVSVHLRGSPIVLPPHARVSFPVELRVPAEIFAERGLGLIFTPHRARVPSSVWRSSFWPDLVGMKESVVSRFEALPSETATARGHLLSRKLAKEEPSLRDDGRWLVSGGLTVKEEGAAWRFEVSRLPDEPLRPAMAELPLPLDFVFGRGTQLKFYYRLSGGASEAMMDAYFRTENGNLYEVWPRLTATATRQLYAQSAENFTMAFYGRAELPWRFLENKAVALVFFFRPSKTPATFEVENVEITRWEAAPDVLFPTSARSPSPEPRQ